MSIRIYALAQQLKVETKTIVDVLKTLGIEGKGSALASLTEEEVGQVKTAIHKSSAKTPKSGAPVRPDAPLQRPASPVSVGKIPVIKNIPTKPTDKKADLEPDAVCDQESVVAVDIVSSEPVLAPTPVEETQPVEPERVEPEKIEPVEPVEVVSTVEEVTVVEQHTTVAEKSESAKPTGHTLPPPIGRIDLTSLSAMDGGKGAGPKKSSPLTAFRKSSPEQPAEPPKPVAPAPQPTPPAPQAPITTGLSAPGHAAAVRRDDYRGPMRVITDKIPNLDTKRKKTDGDEKSTSSGTAKTTGPIVRLAPVPKAPTTKPGKNSKEPAPQKPDVKLPPEAIRAAVQGSTTKLVDDHIRKHEERQRLKEEEKKARESKKPLKRGGVGVAKEPVVTDASDDSKGGKGVKKRFGAAPETIAVSDQMKKKRRGSANRNRDEGDDDISSLPRRLVRKKKKGQRASSTAAPRKSDLVIQLPCTVKQFAEQTGLSVAMVIKKLLEMGTPLMINAQLDREAAELLVEAFELQVEIRDQVTLEDRLVTAAFEQVDPPESLKARPPVVTVLGHVDHGKTTLLDRIIHQNVVAGEKGGITQHIRAYRVKTDNGEDVTFVDTPGHEAFTEMRARGANCTDIAILVVAADDGVMPQTEEAISHIKAAGVPIVVALNKMDLPGVNPDRVIQELAANDLLTSEWGGDVEVVRVSALTGMGFDKLLSTLQIIAELHELKANPDRPAIGMALEAEMQAGQGVVCKVLVQDGTLRTGDVVVCGAAYGRVKAMYDTLDTKKQIDEATPGTPINLIGLDVAPSAGSKFCVLNDISDARVIAEQRANEVRKVELADVQSHVTLETLFQRISSSQSVQTLNVIIRADVRGSIEAIRKELGKLDHPEVKIKILQATVGGITEADVQLADASDAIIVGFNVVPDENARAMAEKKKVQIRRYDIIYNLSNDIKAALEGMLKPVSQVKELGRALVQKVYTISRVGSIAGCRVISGTIERDSRIRIIRESRIIGEYPLDSLKREKDDVKEIREGYECGMKLKGFNDLKEGDILEAYKIEEIARTF